MTAAVPSRAAIARARWRLFGLSAVLALVGIALIAGVALNAREVGDRLDGLGPAAMIALVPLGAAAVVAMVPVSLVAGAIGFAAGVAAGTPAALAAAVFGAIGCALLARRTGTPAARHAFGHRLARSVAWLDARPRRAVITARLVPGLPFNGTSYALGLTGIAMSDVALGTALGFAPRCFAYVALGGSLRDLESPEARVALGASVLLAVLVVVVPRIALRGAVFTEGPTREEDSDG